MMTWPDNKLKVDLLASVPSENMESPDGMQTRRPARHKILKWALLAAILIALVLCLGLQGAHMYLTITTQQRPQMLQLSDRAPAKARHVDDKWSQPATKVVIYSYPGMNSLPLGDLIEEVLSNHPQVLYVSKANNLLTSACRTFPIYNKNHVKHQVDSLMSCNPWLLRKLQKAGSLDHGSCGGTADCSQSRCEAAELRVVSLTQGCGIDLERLYQLNETIEIVHITADPRLLSASVWRPDTGSQKFKVDRSHDDERNEEMKELAQDYCELLTGDINAMRRNATKASGTSFSQRYFFLRHEDLMKNPYSMMMEMFNFFELHMTEEIENGLKAVPGVELHDLYKDSPSINLGRKCREPIGTLGYPFSTEVKQGVTKLKPVEQWWRADI